MPRSTPAAAPVPPGRASMPRDRWLVPRRLLLRCTATTRPARSHSEAAEFLAAAVRRRAVGPAPVAGVAQRVTAGQDERGSGSEPRVTALSAGDSVATTTMPGCHRRQREAPSASAPSGSERGVRTQRAGSDESAGWLGAGALCVGVGVAGRDGTGAGRAGCGRGACCRGGAGGGGGGGGRVAAGAGAGGGEDRRTGCRRCVGCVTGLDGRAEGDVGVARRTGAGAVRRVLPVLRDPRERRAEEPAFFAAGLRADGSCATGVGAGLAPKRPMDGTPSDPPTRSLCDSPSAITATEPATANDNAAPAPNTWPRAPRATRRWRRDERTRRSSGRCTGGAWYSGSAVTSGGGSASQRARSTSSAASVPARRGG